MIQYVIALALLVTTLSAKEILDEQLRFKITFPEGSGWSEVAHNATQKILQSWSSVNQQLGIGLVLMTIDNPMTHAKPTFKENAIEWKNGVLKSTNGKEISSRFAKLADHDSFEVIYKVDDGEDAAYYSSWIFWSGAVSYAVSVSSRDQKALKEEIASNFLKSFSVNDEKTAQQGAAANP